MKYHETLGMIIKKSRQNKKLRQIEVSKSASISRNYLSDIENDRYIPSLKTFLRLASILELDLNLLTKMTEIQVKNYKEDSKCTEQQL
ncbi:helix-turn-helix domain-containing protein [Bacillus pseudomycoides]|uniref:helix-turn-helix domain-containing protein n=1 Tax=Bacillus pseudomycoides TaxID=64104 RepID=UPI000BEB55B9|nr:helix-turn-helix transcriptional regulator [Bacillus pseudomycoides]PDY44525.1 transcriptional regulator [Bacillus pseudomycoides]PHB52681.1 transcriptional regulator [Bacillus pseudomycoides]